MTPRESEIMDLIKMNPTISQQEIADILNIQRSSVAVHINNLSKQGYILGRCYILRDEPYVTVVGGANINIVGYSNEKLVRNDSNSGHIAEFYGGVGFNVSENLSKLGIRTSLISTIGEDEKGKNILAELNLLDVDTGNMFILPSGSTSVYLAILDENRNMDIAINDEKILGELTPELILKRKQIIENAEANILDANLNIDTLEYIFKNIKQKHFIDATSLSKAKKIVGLLENIYFLRTNKKEAEFLSGIEIVDAISAVRAGKELIKKGVKSTVITFEEKGSIYIDKTNVEMIEKEKINIINSLGSEDAFMAGYVYSYVNGNSVLECLQFANVVNKIVLNSESTSSENVSLKNIQRELAKKNKK